MKQHARDSPLMQPVYGASLPVAVVRFWRKFGIFRGRASRSEYWWWALVEAVVTAIGYGLIFVGGTVDPNTGASTAGPLGAAGSVLVFVWWLATLVPSLALTWRRLHDANGSGGFAFVFLIPIVGWIILLVFLLMGPNPNGARFD